MKGIPLFMCKSSTMKRVIHFSIVLLTAWFFHLPHVPKPPKLDYLGQKPPGSNAELFAFGQISTDAYEHSAPTFSPDGKTVLWGIIELPSWRAKLWEMNKVDGQWSAPHAPSFSDQSADYVYPSFSPDGKVLYFSSRRVLPSGDTPSINKIWKVAKTPQGWGTPTLLESLVSERGYFALSSTQQGNLYFSSGKFQSPDWNIYTSTQNKTTNSKPVQLSQALNSPTYEDGPFVAPDESFLIFESDRPGGVEGSIDLYICFRAKNGTWSSPINMGPKINTAASERFARLSPDGKYLFFGSSRRKVEGNTNFDVYWIDAGVIGELKKAHLAAK